MVSDSLLYVKGLFLLKDLPLAEFTQLEIISTLFVLDERKTNRGVRMCRRGSQLKIKLIFNREEMCDVTLPW